MSWRLQELISYDRRRRNSEGSFSLSIFTLYVVVIITVRLLEPGHLEEDYPITTVFENKRFSTFFEGCFLRCQVSSNGFKVFNGCIDEP